MDVNKAMRECELHVPSVIADNQTLKLNGSYGKGSFWFAMAAKIMGRCRRENLIQRKSGSLRNLWVNNKLFQVFFKELLARCMSKTDSARPWARTSDKSGSEPLEESVSDLMAVAEQQDTPPASTQASYPCLQDGPTNVISEKDDLSPLVPMVPGQVNLVSRCLTESVRTKSSTNKSEKALRKKSINRAYYEQNKSVISKKKAAHYRQNKSVICEKRSDHYNQNKCVITKNKAAHYRQNKSVICEKRADHYSQNKSVITKNKTAHYRQNKSVICEKRADHYNQNKSAISKQRASYYDRNKSVISKKKATYYDQKRTDVSRKNAVRREQRKSSLKVRSSSSANVRFKRTHSILYAKMQRKILVQKLKASILKRSTVKRKSELTKILAQNKAEGLVIRATNAKRSLKIKRDKGIQTLHEKSKEYVEMVGPNCNTLQCLGELYHTSTSEPYFWESSYTTFPESKHGVEQCMTLDEDGVMRFGIDTFTDDEMSETELCSAEPGLNENGIPQRSKKVKERPCTVTCRYSQSDLDRLTEYHKLMARQNSKPETTLRRLKSFLYDCDICKNPSRLGHSLACIDSAHCNSGLRSLRALQTHSVELRTLVRNLYAMLRCQNLLMEITNSLEKGDHKRLEAILKIVEKSKDGYTADDSSRCNVSEEQLLTDNAKAVSEFYKSANSLPDAVCVSCERLLFERSMMKKISSRVRESNAWERFKREMNITESDDTLRLCDYCHGKFRSGEMPNRCVLNGLRTDPIPNELQGLNFLEKILIQKGNCFQTVIRLGNVISHRPKTEMVKAVKGCVFHLPLPTEATINSVINREKTDDVHILVNGVPTRKREIWQSLVNFEKVTKAIQCLKDINPLYEDMTVRSAEQIQTDMAINDNGEPIADRSLLVPITANDILESYTVHPVDANRAKTSDANMYQMLKAEGESLKKSDNVDLVCFPFLFPTGQFGMFHPRQKQIRCAEIVKSRLLNKDARYRRDSQYLFHLLWESELRALANGIFHTLRSKQFGNMTAAGLLQNLQANEESLHVNLGTVFASVRGTKQYWIGRTCEVNCMVREIGPPTWYLTFSSAEYYWNQMDDYLRKRNPDMSSATIGALCASDPVSVVRVFEQRFKSILNFMMSSQPFGEVTHYFWRLEFQSRGAPHVHMMLWIKDAPVIGKNPPGEVLAYIQKHITCELPDPVKNPKLNELVRKFQMHKCSSYCQRRTKVGGRFVTRCRFGFPRRCTENAVLHDLVSSIRHRKSGKSGKRLYELKRVEGEERVNDYNPILLLLFEANIDVQFIADNQNAVSEYITKYVTKNEKSSLDQVWSEISECDSLSKKLWKFVMKMLQNRECGAFEAAVRLLGIPLYGKSDPVKYINVRAPQERTRRLKSFGEVERLSKENPETEDIYENNWIDDYYPNRPDTLESTCLYDFIRNYDYETRCDDPEGKGRHVLQNDKGFLRERVKPYLINHKMYDPKKDHDRSNYFRSILFLFRPWRSESELLGDYSSYEEAYSRQVDSLQRMHAYHEKLTKLSEAKEALQKQLEAETPQPSKVNSSNLDPENQFVQGVELQAGLNAAMDDLYNAMLDNNKQNLDELIEQLNDDQRRVFEKVRSSLGSKEPNALPLRMFISGVGGSGKSFLIDVIKCYVREQFQKDRLVVAIACPTGLSAFQVRGVTIHKLFQMPVEHGKTAEYKELPEEARKIMQAALRDMQLLIIDEISMVSNLMLLFIHLRLQQVFSEHDDWFANKNILAFGDLLQLMPVMAQPVFCKIPEKLVSETIGGCVAVDIWQGLFKYDELTINMRQKDDEQYQNILDAVRIGKVDDQCFESLKSRLIQTSPSDVYEECVSKGYSPVALFPKNDMCKDFNELMLKRCNSTIEVVEAIDEFSFANRKKTNNRNLEKLLQKRNDDASATAGLEKTLRLAVGCRIMLRRNIQVENGLVNGAMGTLTGFKRELGRKKILTLTVLFDGATEAQDIKTFSVKFELCSNVFIERQQFPVVLAYGITIHKSQGLTLEHAIIYLGRQVFSKGMAYVALSRVKKLENVYITHLHRSAFKTDQSCIEEYNRLRKAFCPHLPQFQVNVGKRKRSDQQSVTVVKKVCIEIVGVRGKSKQVVQPTSKTRVEPIPVPCGSAATFHRRIGFPNPDKHACYANATLVCLFEQEAVKDFLGDSSTPDSTLKTIFKHYASRDSAKLMAVEGARPLRELLGTPFTDPRDQDADEFLCAVFDKLPNSLYRVFESNWSNNYTCSKCNQTWTEQADIKISHFLPLPKDKNSIQFTDLFGENVCEDACRNCGQGPVRSRHQLIAADRYVILQLGRFDYGNNAAKINTLITGFDRKMIIIDGFRFVCSALILHSGTKEGGHYTAYVYDNAISKWQLYDDDAPVAAKHRLVSNMKNAYMLFLTKVEP